MLRFVENIYSLDACLSGSACKSERSIDYINETNEENKMRGLLFCIISSFAATRRHMATHQDGYRHNLESGLPKSELP